MFKFIRLGLIVSGLLFALFFFNSQIRAMNVIKEDGASVMFKIRPVDPRAFMQGDYMTLRYSEESLPRLSGDDPSSGLAIISVDGQGVGTFVRLDDGAGLNPKELHINYARMFRSDVTYGGERFFFQEGTAGTYEAAEYGLFKVAPSGRAMLVGLVGEDLKILTPPPNP